jgi:hypothetical protein
MVDGGELWRRGDFLKVVLLWGDAPLDRGCVAGF